MFRKGALNLDSPYTDQIKGEDTEFIEKLFVQDELAIDDRPDLYVYCINGENTWDTKHFNNIIESSVLLNPADTVKLKQTIAS